MHLIRCIFVYITTFEIHRYFQVKRLQTLLFVLGQKFHLNIHFERNQKYIVTILPIYYNFEWRQFYETLFSNVYFYIVSALTVPAFATSSLYSTNVYHFRTAKDSSAARYVLNCHTDGIPVSGTKISLWQGTGHSSQEWFVDWTTGSLNNPTAALRPNQNRTLAINADRSAIGTVCNVIPSTGNVYNDYNITLVGSHSTRPTEVKLQLPARYNHSSPVYITTHGIGNYCTWNYISSNQTWYMAN